MANDEIILINGHAHAHIVPSDGLIVKVFSVNGKNILFPDTEIDVCGKPKRRGGIPILFPQAGALDNPPDGYKLCQHGFARDMQWNVTGNVTDSTANFRLNHNEETFIQYPFHFEVNVSIVLTPKSLDYVVTIINLSDHELWAAPGLHPYFAIDPAKRQNLTTDISGYDIKTHTLTETLFFPVQDVNLHIPDTGIVSMIPGGGFLRPSGKLAVWTDRADYICVEPWTGGVGSLLDPIERLTVKPDSETSLSMRIEVDLI